jgi:hypothetical protein
VCASAYFALCDTPVYALLGAGQLPYLTHGMHAVASYTSIVKYISGLNIATIPAVGSAPAPEALSTDLDMMLSPAERATRTAWAAHVQNVVGDLLVRFPCAPFKTRNSPHPS